MKIQLMLTFAALGFVVAPAFAQSPSAPMAHPTPKPKSVHATYSCHNLKVPVIYENAKARAVVGYAGKSYILPQVPSADGARYMNSKLQWWSKGMGATLTSVTDGKPDTLLATCQQIKKK